MQTFRAYVQDAAGAITWAAWVEAAHLEDARTRAHALCPHGAPSVDLWSSAERRTIPSDQLDPV